MKEILKNDMANGPFVYKPKIFCDERGYFFEAFNEEKFNEMFKTDFHPVQDNESKSDKGVIRGLHFQCPPYDQAKLVRVIKGAVFDVAIDIRKGSPTYGKYTVAYLTGDNHHQFFVPRGFAHGFIALEDDTVFQYKCDNYYNKESEGAILYNDETINIPWEMIIGQPASTLIVSDKDKANKPLSELDSPFVYQE